MAKQIQIDSSAGFCFGVDKAIQTAEQFLEKGEPVYSLGSMVHNPMEVLRLEKKGLQTISHDDLNEERPGKVLFRAHGEPPSSYKIAEKHHIEVIDATCPIVLKLQQRIRKRFLSLNPAEEQIIIFGKKNHPETIGLMGQTDNTAILVTDPHDISQVETGKINYLYSQTTMDPDQYRQLEDNLKKLQAEGHAEKLRSHCSICGQMKRRKPELEKFVADKDLVLFVSGENSSNGAMLYRFCKSLNPETYWIHTVKDITPAMIQGKTRIGISGATSTPVWQLEELRDFMIQHFL